MSWSLRPLGRNLGTAEKKMTRRMLNLLEQKKIFDRWCSSKEIGSDYPKLRQLMLVEEFKRCINSDVMSFLDETEVETLEKKLLV